jgi:hypothetical protein
MAQQNKQSLAPRNRKDLYDDDIKVGAIVLTKGEKLILAQALDTPIWDVIMKVWRKQRMMQIAATSLNSSRSHEDLIAYQGQLHELNHLENALRKIATDFNKSQDSQTEKKSNEGNPPPTGAREKAPERTLISTVK